MTPEEQIAVDMADIEQVTLSPAWKVVTRRLQDAIDSFTDSTMKAPLHDVERLRQRVLAYKELLDLPATIADQFKEMKAQEPQE